MNSEVNGTTNTDFVFTLLEDGTVFFLHQVETKSQEEKENIELRTKSMYSTGKPPLGIDKNIETSLVGDWLGVQ